MVRFFLGHPVLTRKRLLPAQKTPKSVLKNEALAEFFTHTLRFTNGITITSKILSDNQKRKYIYVIYRMGGPYWKNILSRSQKRPETEGRWTFFRPSQNIFPLQILTKIQCREHALKSASLLPCLFKHG